MLFASLFLLCQAALAAPAATLIYDSALLPSLGHFSLALESQEQASGRPQLGLVDNALSAVPGNGNFTAWEFARLEPRDFTLLVRFYAPIDAEDSNSGIFLLQGDPAADLAQMPKRDREQYQTALAAAAAKKQAYGTGPFELDFFAYEIQIARGRAVAHDPVNKRSGTFYGVPEGEAPGTQQILHSYELLPGEEYELMIEARAGVLTTHLRSVVHQPKFVAIARFQPQARAEDAVRGGLPHALLLQAYWNNGTSAKGIRFTHLSLAQ